MKLLIFLCAVVLYLLAALIVWIVLQMGRAVL
jgi:hypothetical protein